MDKAVDLTITVMAIVGLWALWDLGIKKWLLAAFRERLSELRWGLFQLGMSGELDFDSELYRAVEALLCGLLRFGHHITFLGYLFSSHADARARLQEGFVDASEHIDSKVKQAPSNVQPKLARILTQVDRCVVVYMFLSSFVFMGSCFVLLVTRGLRACYRALKQRARLFEQEAYRLELLQPIVTC